jgi:predicted acetyltransferase
MDGALHGSSRPARGPFVVRPALDSDLERVLEIHVVAFPDARSIETRRRHFLSNRLGGFEHFRVVERAGVVVGHAFSFPIATWFGGRAVDGFAIAGVGVAPEARGQGVATALLDVLHTEAGERGSAFTLLYPFRQAFYARFGYASVAAHRVLTLSPRAIPTRWRDATDATLRRADGRDRAELARVYRAAARRGTGSIDRSERAWEKDLLDERRQWLVLEHGGVVTGYVTFQLHQAEAHGRVRAEVIELVATEDTAQRRLFAAVGALCDQVGDITVPLAADDGIDIAFLDVDRDRGGTEEIEHTLGIVSSGPMIRLTDPRTALVARGYATDGAIELAVDGEPPFSLVVERGSPRIAPASGGTVLSTTGDGLAAIAFGGLSVRDAVRVGWMDSSDPDVVDAARRLLYLPPFFSVDGF